MRISSIPGAMNRLLCFETTQPFLDSRLVSNKYISPRQRIPPGPPLTQRNSEQQAVSAPPPQNTALSNKSSANVLSPQKMSSSTHPTAPSDPARLPSLNLTSYECTHCTHNFYSLLTYNTHLFHLPDSIQPRCSKCKIAFASQCLLNIHNNSRHSTTNNGVFRGWFSCFNCGDAYEYREDWEKHKTGHGVRWLCDFCKKLFYTERDWDRHMSSCKGKNTLR